MKQIGWFVVGDGKFGFKSFNTEPTFVAFDSDEEVIQTERAYWYSRGYILIEAFAREEECDLVEVFVKDVD